jgi:hypothetical protein
MDLIFREKGSWQSHDFVISTGAKRSGEICGFLLRFSLRPFSPYVDHED